MKRIFIPLLVLLLLVPSIAFAETPRDLPLIREPVIIQEPIVREPIDLPTREPVAILAPLLSTPEIKEPIAKIGKAKEFFDLRSSDIDPEQMVAIAIRGWCGAGHGIHIDDIELVDGELVVRYTTSDPDPNLIYPAVMVYVYHAIPLNITAKPTVRPVCPPILPRQPILMPVLPIVIDGEIYIAARDFARAYGYPVNWDSGNRCVQIGDISVKIDDDTAYVNDRPVQMPGKAKLIDGRTMLPLRFLVREFAYQKGDS